jgi:hypothetical protein
MNLIELIEDFAGRDPILPRRHQHGIVFSKVCRKLFSDGLVAPRHSSAKTTLEVLTSAVRDSILS